MTSWRKLAPAESIDPVEIKFDGKWRTLLLLALAEFLAMAVWFSASAVVPSLTSAWNLDEGGQAWLTMSVQIGFVVGALGSAIVGLADRIPSRWLFAASAFLAGVATALIPLTVDQIQGAVLFRFMTGLFLAGVYPVGMKIMATWTKTNRGLAIGLLVGALTLGSATPHLINAFGAYISWQQVLFIAAILAFTGSLIGAFFVGEGPFRASAPRFRWSQLGSVVVNRDVALANVGYLGYMWELYAMWAWIPLFLLIVFRENGVDASWASVASFFVIALGGLGSLVAGQLADRFGRTTITIASLAISGSASIIIGFLLEANPLFVSLVALIWGFAVVADSAQFSASITELSDERLVGTALTFQTSLGFLLTLFTIRMIPYLVKTIGWQYAFAFLAIGPAVGILAMWILRNSPSSVKMAGGKG